MILLFVNTLLLSKTILLVALERHPRTLMKFRVLIAQILMTVGDSVKNPPNFERLGLCAFAPSDPRRLSRRSVFLADASPLTTICHRNSSLLAERYSLCGFLGGRHSSVLTGLSCASLLPADTTSGPERTAPFTAAETCAGVLQRGRQF